MNNIVIIKAITGSDISQCRDKAQIRKYLKWRLVHHKEGDDEGASTLKRISTLFVVRSKNRYSYDTVLETVLDLLIDDLLIKQLVHYSWSWWVYHEEKDDSYDPDQMSCFSLACAFGDEALVTDILNNDNVCVTQRRDYVLGYPIEAAVQKGQNAVVRLLLARKPALHFWLGNGRGQLNPLCDAVFSNNLDTLDILLDSLAVFKHHDQAVRRAFLMATSTDNLEAFTILLARGPWHCHMDMEDRLKRWILFRAGVGPSKRIMAFLLNDSPPLDPNNGIKEYGTPLKMAVERGNLEFVQYLLEHGADPNYTSRDGDKTALQAAASAGHVRCMTLLLEAGAKNEWTVTAHDLLQAILHGPLSAVTFMLESGKIDSTKRDRMEILAEARRIGLTCVIDALEQYGFATRRQLHAEVFDIHVIDAIITTGIINETDLIKCRDKDLILRYLNWRMLHDTDHDGIRHEGVSNAITAVKLFVTKTNGRYDYDTALQRYLNVLTDQFMIRSVYYWTSETSRLLWGIPVPPLNFSDTESEGDGDFEPEAPAKAQIDRAEMACLSLACAFGDLEVINQILGNDGVTLDGEKRLFPLGHPLQAAVRQGQQHVVRLLLDRGSELQRRDAIEANFNVLEDAVISNRLEMLRMLLGFAKQTNHFKHMCEWAFCMACYCGDVEAFKLLLETYGPPCLGQRRESALVFLACWASSLPIVQILFSRYPDLDPNSRSKCPMFRCSSDHNLPRFTTWMGIAANRGNVPLVRFLLDRGGDPSLALSAAAAGGSVRCLELLVKAGATWERKMKGRWSLHPLAAAGLGGQYPEAISFLLENGFSPMDDPTGRFVTTDKLSDEERKHRSSMYNTTVAHDHRPWHRPCNACIAEVLIPCGYDFRTTYDWALRVVPYNP